MTGKEYTKELQLLREKRDYHKRMAQEYADKMDTLTSDERLARLNCGEYVRYKWVNGDRSHYTDYTYYLHVESVEPIQRGFYLNGKGFSWDKFGVRTMDCIRCYWEDVDNGNITSITKEEFLKVFEKAVSEFKENGLKAFEN
jgi:hypothetical protein